MTQPKHSCIGRKRGCGCWRSAVSDYHDKSSVAEAVSEMIREGLIVERMTTEEFRDIPHKCGHCTDTQKDLELEPA